MLGRYKKAVVTGGCGFIGSHLVDTLVSLGKEVVVFDNLSTGLVTNVAAGAQLIEGDVRNPEQVARALRDADLVFHVAGNSNTTRSVNDPRLDYESNSQGCLNILQAALHAHVEKIVFVSSASVYGTPQSFPICEDHPTSPFVPYGVSKLAGEAFCRSFFETYETPVVIVRPFCVYGPRENPEVGLVEVSRYMRWHLNDRPIQVVGDPDQKSRDFVHVSDVVRGLILLADRGVVGEAYNLGSGDEVTMRQLTVAIGAVDGGPASMKPLRHITDDTYRLVSDITKARSHGYTPKMSLKEGLIHLMQHLGPQPVLPAGATIFKRDQQAEI